MLQRYMSQSVNKIWNTYDVVNRWKDVEIAHLEALYADGVIPEADLNVIKSRIHVSLDNGLADLAPVPKPWLSDPIPNPPPSDL